MAIPAGTAAELTARHDLHRLPAEGGWFRQTWAGPADPEGRPAGTAIMALLTPDPDGFSAMHHLPNDEIWYFHQGDPLQLLLLSPHNGDHRLIHLGADENSVPQAVAPAGWWMGARTAPGGRWSLFGTSMAPGFLPEDYHGADTADIEQLCTRHPRQAPLIRALHRPEAPTRMPDDIPNAANR